VPAKPRVCSLGIARAIALLAFAVLLIVPAAPADAAYWHSCRTPQGFRLGSLRAHHVHCAKARRIIGGFYREAQADGPDIYVDHFHCVAFTGGVGCHRGTQRVRVSGLPERLPIDRARSSTTKNR
jgi:hypothetical protein